MIEIVIIRRRVKSNVVVLIVKNQDHVPSQVLHRHRPLPRLQRHQIQILLLHHDHPIIRNTNNDHQINIKNHQTGNMKNHTKTAEVIVNIHLLRPRIKKGIMNRQVAVTTVTLLVIRKMSIVVDTNMILITRVILHTLVVIRHHLDVTATVNIHALNPDLLILLPVIVGNKIYFFSFPQVKID